MLNRISKWKGQPPVLQSGRFVLAMLLLAIDATAQNEPALMNQASKNSLIVFSAPSQNTIKRAVSLSANYMERACEPNGRFIYSVNVKSGLKSDQYNIVRHSGAVYALAMMQDSEPNDYTHDAMIRAALFLLQNYVKPGVRPDQLAVWSDPIAKASVAKLGATGLGLVALAAVEKTAHVVPLSDLEALGRFILFLQRPDGSFISEYLMDSGPVEGFESLYYPGEAALGLISLYEMDHNILWLNAAAQALSYLAQSRRNLSDVPPDHWALIATTRLLRHNEYKGSRILRQQLIRHAVQICQSLMRDQLQHPASDDLIGSFDLSGRTTPTATRVEGLLAALEFVPDRRLRLTIRGVIDRGVAFLLRAEITDGPYAGGMPGAAISGASESSDIRIDFVQHAMCAWLRYLQLTGKPPRGGKHSRKAMDF
jgi:hypothetical protein